MYQIEPIGENIKLSLKKIHSLNKKIWKSLVVIYLNITIKWMDKWIWNNSTFYKRMFQLVLFILFHLIQMFQQNMFSQQFSLFTQFLNFSLHKKRPVSNDIKPQEVTLFWWE